MSTTNWPDPSSANRSRGYEVDNARLGVLAKAMDDAGDALTSAAATLHRLATTPTDIGPGRINGALSALASKRADEVRAAAESAGDAATHLRASAVHYAGREDEAHQHIRRAHQHEGSRR
ncbi:MAG: hypothetical protein J2O49_00800 [Sciscionella sp.]|nr:hypothetical protein [Sciscionella sp.]